MIVTTSEAFDKWCPFVRVYDEETRVGGINRVRTTHLEDVVFCHSDDCMCWRWHDEDADEGYCGLAGKPAGVK